MRKAVVAPLLLFLALSSTGQTESWKTYRNTSGNFSVLFPGEPQDQDTGAGTGVESHTLAATEKPAVYTVVFANMATPQTVDDASFRVFRDAVFRALPGCEAGPEQPAAPPVENYIGHWYRLDCDSNGNKVTVEGNLYWGARHSYAVMVLFPTTSGEPKATKNFRESFAILDPSK